MQSRQAPDGEAISCSRGVSARFCHSIGAIADAYRGVSAGVGWSRHHLDDLKYRDDLKIPDDLKNPDDSKCPTVSG